MWIGLHWIGSPPGGSEHGIAFVWKNYRAVAVLEPQEWKLNKHEVQDIGGTSHCLSAMDRRPSLSDQLFCRFPPGPGFPSQTHRIVAFWSVPNWWRRRHISMMNKPPRAVRWQWMARCRTRNHWPLTSPCCCIPILVVILDSRCKGIRDNWRVKWWMKKGWGQALIWVSASAFIQCFDSTPTIVGRRDILAIKFCVAHFQWFYYRRSDGIETDGELADPGLPGKRPLKPWLWMEVVMYKCHVIQHKKVELAWQW